MYKTLIVKDYNKETFDWTPEITENDIAFIISESEKTIYAWIGQRASIHKKYKAGTLSTKIKSQYQLYGFKTMTVNQGEEIGALKEEVERLQSGSGTMPTEEELVASKAPSAAQKPSPRAAAKPAAPAKAGKVVATPSGGGAFEVKNKQLQADLDAEKKKSQQLSAENEELKETIASLQSEIADLKAKLESTLAAAPAGGEESAENLENLQS
jgi:uncharacterized small protein (DUF1192 family)